MACQSQGNVAPSELVPRADPPLLPEGEQPIKISDAVVAKVSELLAEEGDPSLQLRIYVTGGGCSGFQYGFAFDDEVKEDDVRVAREPITVVVDAMSLQYLVGAEIDYEDRLDGARFVIRNPNATSTCGCGSSFTV
ncbi:MULTISPECIES: iron-sulfur cluster insertion protein ErpA [unclassified Rubrivivax]|uniref:iron-sulfur cluster insertion protein ErpA n=1 Tax=unclassified Rubrivivax TaxID=2649762 RepID=UPI001E31C5D9|nr:MULTISPECIES: iron-sulfur cluster insertion protein ErpA [unclassified Rubrivivax]MCC9595652.1 iron-sulfur cluster insertion protein ErpA [Rubrivivax sp. JA1055]MCC9646841.1 iron-sulfur cluster insertion protein ErpA [Rubrivivax sp. JA1029]